jgi:hypothetical protein
MAIDPLHLWQTEASVEFCAREESLADSFRDFFLQCFGASVSQNDVAWLADIFAAFISYQQIPSPNALRVVAESLLPILAEIDREMSSSKRARARWMPIVFGLGLPSSYETRQARVARNRGVSKQNLTNQVSRFLRAVNLQPAFSNNGRFLAFH